MNKLVVLVAALSLSACATPSPRTCADAIRVVDTAEQIAAVLIANGIALEHADEIARLVLAGRIAAATACAVAAQNEG